MNLQELSREDLLIVSNMLIEGSTIEEIEAKFISANTRALVDNLHLLLCNKPHSDGSEDCCKYHEEDSYFAESKGCYLKILGKLIDDTEIDESELAIALSFMFAISGVVRNKLIGQSEGVARLVQKLLPLVPLC